MFSARFTRFIAMGAAALAIAGGAYGIVTATASSGSGTTTTTTTTTTPSAQNSGRTLGGGSNARSGSAAGGTSGTVDSVSNSSFTLSTAAGQKVTVNKASSTTYRLGANSTSTNAIKKGDSVLVFGTVSGTTITATQVIAQSTDGSVSGASSATKVVPFQPGAPSSSKQVGQIPANYTQGSGTIVNGKRANKATAAALAAYPGGIVDRVVKMSNGEYEVHNIGVNWPHHIFVNQEFKVFGAD